ncbi:hypothetical protein F5Y19DRAFT_421704 [Xylariaceae sp. FL1651]|nr:hypothetical protein F5Y19DRAFT_421704 [Xylariaceae sp. FL1651]
MLATLEFLADLPLYDSEKPFVLYGFPDHIQPKTNCQYEVHDKVTVQDARGHEQDYRLDECGFEFHRWPSACDLRAEIFESIKGKATIWSYLHETISIVERLAKPSEVFCFDWRLRRTGAQGGVKEQLDNLEEARYRALPPASLMHCDYSYDGGLDTLKIHLKPEEFVSVEEGRAKAKIINIWRPFQTVHKSPLVLCDRRTVGVNDILDVDQVAPTKLEQSMALTYKPEQEFHCLSSHEPEEVALFVSWSSEQDEEIASHTPHGAHIEDDTVNSTGLRESIEVRLIALWS